MWRENKSIRIICVALLALVGYMTLLTHIHKLCRWGFDVAGIYANSWPGNGEIDNDNTIDISCLVDTIDQMENVVQRPSVLSWLSDDIGLVDYGLLDLDIMRSPLRYPINVKPVAIPNTITDPGGIIDYDSSLGLYVISRFYQTESANDKGTKKSDLTWLGPKGFSTTLDPQKTGRFSHIISTQYLPIASGNPLLYLFDQDLRQFFKVDLDKEEIIAGPRLNATYVGINHIQRGQGIEIGMNRIKIKGKPDDADENVPDYTNNLPTRFGMGYSGENPDNYTYKEFTQTYQMPGTANQKFIPVLGDDGNIRKLDPETLTVEGCLGKLPAIERPEVVNTFMDNMLGYRVKYILHKNEYKGMVCLTLDRTRTQANLIVYNAQGLIIPDGTKEISLRKAEDTAPGALAIVMTIATEWLTPPALVAAGAAVTGRQNPALERRHVMIMPDAMLNLWAMDSARGNWLEYTGTIAGTYSPSLVLSTIAGLFVWRNAGKCGLSKSSRNRWLAACILLGIPLIITYALTRPAPATITCRFCGKLRRPQEDTCPFCNHSWDATELQAPAWRIVETN